MDWDALMEEAEELAVRLKQTGVDLNEAEKVLGYYLYKNCDEKAMSRYLELMATSPPLRSKKTQVHYRTIRSLWMSWRTGLRGADKARAWGWAVRLARVR
ncbi:MAG: hypothetical protein ACPLRW_04905 [Moorellales bacterium]